MRYAPHDKKQLAQEIRHFIKCKRNFRNSTLQLSDLVEVMNVSRTIVIRVFREEMKTSFREYVTSCRLQHATKALKKNGGRNNMEYVALMAGFSSVQTFRKRFKEKYGMLPSELIS